MAEGQGAIPLLMTLPLEVARTVSALLEQAQAIATLRSTVMDARIVKDIAVAQGVFDKELARTIDAYNSTIEGHPKTNGHRKIVLVAHQLKPVEDPRLELDDEDDDDGTV